MPFSRRHTRGRSNVNKIQIAATGAGVSASALLLSCGLALVANVRTQEEVAARFQPESRQPIVVATAAPARPCLHQELALASALRRVRETTESSQDQASV